eukprot:CAMPEP_0168626646 /NCGR_PEP_ID=MMETSP0449_2-20121227/10754_1 /TAXON_ID=1082188 /ORGANISM="Strombidium rassoulzadegani, Strain ras09" /LENGTH=112 /DNA_ID=CAMNT_0008668677 /DNA_START=332 /DNA_END=670 /DNA_ORIENTATION=-
MVEITENLKAVFGTIRLVLHGLLEALLDVMPEQVVPDAVGTHHNDVVLVAVVGCAEGVRVVLVEGSDHQGARPNFSIGLRALHEDVMESLASRVAGIEVLLHHLDQFLRVNA